MAGVHPLDRGWRRDLPDFRDFDPATVEIRELLRRGKRRRSARSAKPSRVDLREFCTPPVHHGATKSASAAAVLAMLTYFERRATGRVVEGSTDFLYRTARRLDGTLGDAGVCLRTTLKTLARFGCPPERYWPSDAPRDDVEPDAFAYGFRDEIAGLRYIRLDSRNRTGTEVLAAVKSFLTAGFTCVCGASLPAEPTDGDLAFPTHHDGIAAASAFTIVGYDDAARIRSTRGALVVRGTAGPNFGDGGYGRLPYRYVEEQLACDFWTMMRPEWMATGEFEQAV